MLTQNFFLEIIGLLVLYTLVIPNAFGEPVLFDRNFKVEEIAIGMNFPVQMDFVGNDLLVLEKGGDVRLIRDGILQDEPILHVDVNNFATNGLLGITHVKDTVYLYMTQETNYPDEPLVNRIYKYKWNGEILVDPILVNELPANPLQGHSGGVMVADLEGNVYSIIGDLLREGFLQHLEDGKPDDSSIVLKVGLDESVIRPHLSENPFEHYYGIGIRNSFGLTIDPVTGYLWQTENGPENFDEINLIRPGFDGGWKSISGPASAGQIESLTKIDGFTYTDPIFSWEDIVSPTGLTFIDSKQFSEYHDILFVVDFSTGSIFKFNLNNERNGFLFTNSDLNDLVANSGDPIREIMFGTGFTSIVDIKQGPDGVLYLISWDEGGIIYRIGPNEKTSFELFPRKLQDSGLPLEEITCYQGLILMEKKSSGDAVCLKPKSVTKLIERNWAKPVTESTNPCNNPPSPGVNWSKCNFSFSDFSEVNLEGSNLIETNLVGSLFQESNLVKSDLSESNLVLMNFSNANLSHSKLINSKSHHTDYSRAILKDVDLSRADFSYVSFTQADLSEADLSETNLREIDFSMANLSDVNFSGSNLFGVKFFKVNLSGADFSYANLENSDFTNVDLSNTNFFNTNFKDSNFENVILNNTNINDCKINPLCDRVLPSIKITNPSLEEVINHVGTIVIQGTASDESGIAIVEAFAHTLPRDEESKYGSAVPDIPEDWSKWSIELSIPDDQTYRVLVRAIDNTGNVNWAEITINQEPQN